MISNQILQNTIEGLKSIARVELCVMDIDGKPVATTVDEMERCGKPAAEFAKSPADSQEIQGYQYFKIFDEQQLEYVLIAGGVGEDVYMVGKMVAFQIQNLLVAYKERFDKDLQPCQETAYPDRRKTRGADYRDGQCQGQQCPRDDAYILRHKQ